MLRSKSGLFLAHELVGKMLNKRSSVSTGGPFLTLAGTRFGQSGK